MKASTQKRLKKYVNIAAGVTVSPAVFGQVLVTDLSPDVTVTTGNFYDLDLDTNTVNDFRFSVNFLSNYTYGGTSVGGSIDIASVFLGVAGNAIKGNVSNIPIVGPYSVSVDVANRLSVGALISSSGTSGSTWLSSGRLAAEGTIAGYSGSIGNFRGQTGYIGVRFQIGGNTHYGWVRLSAASDGTSLTLMEFGYEATPDTPINAGEGSVLGVNENTLEGKVSIGTSNGNVVVNLNGISSANTKVITATGQELANTSISEGTNEISTNGASGLCIVVVTNGDAVIRKKVVLN